MTSPPAGWHPDPLPSAPGAPALLRYWDGSRWTDHVSPAPPLQQQSFGSPYAAPKSSTTPDGEPLAGWWQRVGAYLIDTVILLTVGLTLALPWVRDLLDVYGDYFSEVFDDAAAGRQSNTDMFDLQRQVARPLIFITTIQLAVGFAYQVGFLMWKQATPGKLVLGLRVRLRETPGPMPIGTVVTRWFAQFGIVGLASLVPFVSTLAGLYSILDVLWPLWDDKKQTLHDKIAKTNVVRVR